MAKKTKATELTVHVLLDRSGSMQSIKTDAIGGFNSYVEELAKTSPDSTLSLTIFDSESIDTIVTNVQDELCCDCNRHAQLVCSCIERYSALRFDGRSSLGDIHD
jgi:hypothetical protein